MELIAFSSRKSGGKTSCAMFFKEHGYTILNFADSLKELLCNIFEISYEFLENNKNNKNIQLNVTDEMISVISKETEISEMIIKETFKKENPKTIREYLQILGTEIIRKNKSEWHVQKLISKIKNSRGTDLKFCIADMRFLNEKQAIEKMGGECWYIIRPNFKDISNHESEVTLNWTHFDNIIINDDTYDALIEKCESDVKGNTRSKVNHGKTNLFLKIDYTSAYLAGYIFLDNSYIKNPFVLENYKLWKCSNKRYPDIFDLYKLSENDKYYVKQIWLKGMCDYMKNSTEKW